MKKLLVVISSLLVLLLLAGCGISQDIYDTVVAEREMVKANLQIMQSQYDSSRQECESLESELEKTITELDTAKSKLSSTQNELDANLAKLVTLQKEADTAKEDLKKTGVELETTKSELKSAQKELTDIKASLIPQSSTLDVTGQKYTNAKCRYSITYPQSWTVGELSSAEVMLAGPMSSKEKYMINITIAGRELPAGAELDKMLIAQNIAIKNVAPDFMLVQSQKSTIGGQPAVIETFTASIAGVKLKETFAFFLKDNWMYAVILNVPVDEYSQYTDEYSLVINSFKFE